MNKISVALVGLTLAFVFGKSVSAQTETADDILNSKIDIYLTAGEKNGFSGSVLVAKQGRIIINKGYGFANREQEIKNSSKTVSTIGSVTKQFTATAILKLTESSHLKVTDTLNKFFKDVPADKQNITVHQLLTHSSGLLDVIGEGDFDIITTDIFFKRLFATKLLQQPGAKYVYSNAGYSILARIIELVSEQEYEAFLHQHLFTPAGMTQTGYFKPQWNDKNIANGYVRGIINVGTMIARYRNAGEISWILKGNGGINSTIEDMYKWYQALKNNRVLSKQLTAQLTTPNIVENDGQTSHYAYGWAIYNSDRNTKIIKHNGGNAIFFHDFFWLPEEDVTIILFTNSASSEAEVAWPIEKLIFGREQLVMPIKKPPYLFVYDFVHNNTHEKAEKLSQIIETEYPSMIKNSDFLNEIGYMILNNTNHSSWATMLFKMNTDLFQQQANLWDSLGDGYKASGNNKKAIEAYKKAIKLDSDIKASRKSLIELGVVIKEERKKKIVVSHEQLSSYIGEYQLKPGFILSVTLENGQLIVQPTGRDPMLAEARSDDMFFLEKLGTKIRFDQDGRGLVISLTLLDRGEAMLAKRL